MGEKGAKLTSQSSRAAEDLARRLGEMRGAPIRTKRMFGGYGIFAADKMFALIDSNGRVFFKVDDSNRARYEAAGAEKHGRMPYYRAPESVLADDAALVEWAQISIEIASRAK